LNSHKSTRPISRIWWTSWNFSPYAAVAQAVFALLYAHKKMGIIPDSILELGRADDSSVVRAVLIQNEKAFAAYAGAQGVNWQKITSQP
jgi:uncharacterized membrane protein YkvA (DUF1232 family)